MPFLGRLPTIHLTDILAGQCADDKPMLLAPGEPLVVLMRTQRFIGGAGVRRPAAAKVHEEAAGWGRMCAMVGADTAGRAAPLDAGRLRAALHGEQDGAGVSGEPGTTWTDVRIVPSTGSTNTDLLRLAAAGA